MRYKLIVSVIATSLLGSAYADSNLRDISGLKKIQAIPEIQSITKYDRSISDKKSSDFYYIVRLQQAPIASFGGNNQGVSQKLGNDLNMQSAEVKAQLKLLAQERASFTNQLSNKLPGVKVDRHYDTVINAVVVRSKTDIYKQLQGLSGVTKVFKDEMNHINMDASLSLINATQIWEQMGGKANAGKNIKVAVIDTGIRPEHPMFSDAGFVAPASLPGNDYCAEVANFCNNKLIVARSAAPTFAVHADEHMSPLGYGSHGSHVAGTAVGNHVNTTFNGVEVELSGVAPGAYLMAYKGLFTTPEGGGSGSNVMLLEMLDWAVKDGADVINNSWGGGAGGDPELSPYKEAFESAEEAGVVVVSAAGNDGPGAQTIGCPSCIESGITVANTFHGRFFANTAQIAGVSGILTIPGVETTFEEDLTGTIKSALSVDAANFEGCSAFAAGSFTDSVALISRGTCNFVDKVVNATDAGATGVVVYNNRPGAPFSMFMAGTTVPSVMVSQANGDAILAALTEENNAVLVNAQAERIVDAESVDTLTSSSSRGPGGDHNSLKPDIAAPGQSILSAVSPDDYGSAMYATFTGTSMASPHVAGAAAIMRQMHPEWSATDIKTALTSTAFQEGLLKDDYATPVDAFDVGAGRLDLATSTVAAVTFDKPSMAMDPCLITCNFNRTIFNKTAAEATWVATVSFDNEDVIAQVSPASLTLDAMGSADFSVNVNASNTDADGWLFGQVTWTDTSGVHPSAHMKIAVTVDDETMVSQTSGNTTVGSEIPMTTLLSNKGNAFDQQVSINVKAPEGMNFVANSESSTLFNSQELLLDLDTNSNRLAWTGNLGSSEFTSSTFPGGFGLPSIAAFGVQLPCADGCDEVAIDLNLAGNGLSYEYAGQRYSRITVSDNGIAIVGGGSTGGTWSNQDLPSSISPNNVLAPFWSDFDLNSDGTDSGGGDLYYGIFDLGTTSEELYLALEWNKAQLYADADGKEYTFQIWISLGESQDIFFQYIELNATLPSDLTVGAEDSSGTQGTNVHYNGAGFAMVAPLAVQLANTDSGNVSLGYSLEVNSPLAFGVEDSAEAIEDGGVITIEPVTNDVTSTTKVVDVSFKHAGTTYYTPKTIELNSSGALDPSTLAIVDAPSNGSATVGENGVVSYTPDADFTGTDSFTYDVADADGNRIAATKVVVNVAPTNDAPTLTAGGAITVVGRKTTTLSVVGNDIDGDALTYTWTQTSGTNAGASSTSSKLSFTAPDVSADETATFSVVANDGTASSNTVTVTVNVQKRDSGSGSFGWLMLLLVPFVYGRKIRK